MATLPENDRIAGPFTAVAGQTAFDADFPLIDAPGDAAGTCVVFVRERAGETVELTLAGGDFAVSGASEAGFTVTLTAAAEAGDRCFIVGRQKQKRLRAHPLGGAVRTPTLEDDARELAARAQEARRDLDRALTAPLGEPGLQLPAAAARRAGVAVFGDTAAAPLDVVAGVPGDMVIFHPLTGAPTSAPAVVSVSSAPVVVSSQLVATAMNWSGDPPAFLLTQGYLTPGDGGRALWKWVAAEPAHPGKFQIASGQWYELAEAKVYPDQLGADGTAAADTAALLLALAIAPALGVPVGILPRTYLIDANCAVNDDNVFVIGDDPSQSVLEQVMARTGWGLAWATTGPTAGGGVANLTFRGHPGLTSGANGGLRFGTDSGATHHHADGWDAKDLIFDSFAQYGMGVQSGSEWDARRIKVLNHGYTAYNPGSCIGFYVYPLDETTKSRGGNLEDIYSEISDASRDFGANSAAIKLQTHVDLTARNIRPVGGTEAVISIDCLERGVIAELDVVMTNNNASYASRAGVVYQSRSSVHGFVSTRCDIPNARVRKRDSSVVSINGWLFAGGWSAMANANTEGLNIGGLSMPGLNVGTLSYTVVKGCELKRIECEDFLFGQAVAGGTAHASLRSNDNRIRDLSVASGPGGYDGDASYLSGIKQTAAGNLGWRAYGTGNAYGEGCELANAHSTANQLAIYGTSQKFDKPTVRPGTGRSIRFMTGSSLNEVTDPVGHAGGLGWLDEGTSNAIRRAADTLLTIATNADVTVTGAPRTVRHTGTLSADRKMTLDPKTAGDGAVMRISRPGAGAFNLNLHDAADLVTPITALTTGTWADVTVTAGAFVVTGKGSL